MKILIYLIPFMFVLGGSGFPIRRRWLISLNALAVMIYHYPSLNIHHAVALATCFLAMCLGYSDIAYWANEGVAKNTPHKIGKGKRRRWYIYLAGYCGWYVMGFTYFCCFFPLSPTAELLVTGSYMALIVPVAFYSHRLFGRIFKRLDVWGLAEMGMGITTMLGLSFTLS